LYFPVINIFSTPTKNHFTERRTSCFSDAKRNYTFGCHTCAVLYWVHFTA